MGLNKSKLIERIMTPGYKKCLTMKMYTKGRDSAKFKRRRSIAIMEQYTNQHCVKQHPEKKPKMKNCEDSMMSS